MSCILLVLKGVILLLVNLYSVMRKGLTVNISLKGTCRILSVLKYKIDFSLMNVKVIYFRLLQKAEAFV